MSSSGQNKLTYMYLVLALLPVKPRVGAKSKPSAGSDEGSWDDSSAEEAKPAAPAASAQKAPVPAEPTLSKVRKVNCSLDLLAHQIDCVLSLPHPFMNHFL